MALRRYGLLGATRGRRRSSEPSAGRNVYVQLEVFLFASVQKDLDDSEDRHNLQSVWRISGFQRFNEVTTSFSSLWHLELDDGFKKNDPLESI